jgi:transcriptional regulator with XRE-family HTH domain
MVDIKDRFRRDYGDINRSVGQQIRQKRGEVGATQTAVAESTGLPVHTLRRIEAGRNNISVGDLVTIAGALDCAAGELLPAEMWGSSAPTEPEPARPLAQLTGRPGRSNDIMEIGALLLDELRAMRAERQATDKPDE